LHELLDRERESADRGLRGQTLRLSAEFHLQLAELAGNTPLSRFLGSLVPPICLALAQFDATSNERETWRSHQAIVDAVERRNSAAAVELMNAHLDGLERQLFQAM
jgi:DNA-binding GntR family transcriptional regulator